MKEWLFDTDISSGCITMNTRHQRNLHRLFETILSVIPDCKNILLNYWTYRLYDDVIIHALDFMVPQNHVIYTLTLTEGNEIYFHPHSFMSNQGSVTIMDTVDANGLIHHFSQMFRKRNFQLTFSFLDMSK